MTVVHILLTIIGAITCADEVNGKQVDVYWNRTNSWFTASTYFIDVNLKDTVEFKCPYYPDSHNQADLEAYVIYRLPKTHYDSCDIPINSSEAELRKLGIEKVKNCSHPFERNDYNFLVDNFGALPAGWGGFNYQPGHSYYFATLSTGFFNAGGLGNTEASSSACRKHNMKAVVRVCCTDNATFTCPQGAVKCNNTEATTSGQTSGNNGVSTTTKSTTRSSTTSPSPAAESSSVSWSTLKSLVTTEYAMSSKGPSYEKVVDKPGSSSVTKKISIFILILSLLLSTKETIHTPS